MLRLRYHVDRVKRWYLLIRLLQSLLFIRLSGRELLLSVVIDGKLIHGGQVKHADWATDET